MESLKGYRTVIFTIVAALAMIVTLITGTKTDGDVVVIQQGVDQILNGIVAVWTIGSLWLRYVTETPIFQGGKTSANYKRK